MEQEMLEKTILLGLSNKYNSRKSRKLVDKTITKLTKVDNFYYDEKTISSIKSHLLIAGATVTALRALYHEEMEKRKRAKIASDVFETPKDIVTGDITTFMTAPNKIEVFVDDFQYDASISLSRLSKLKVIWGETNLRKLHDFQYLKSLETVVGDLYTSYASNLDKVTNLKVVTGDIHAEKLENLDIAKNLIYVGGKIYHQDKEMTFDEYKRQNKVLTK